eukprot:gene18430-20280_t
MEDIQKGKKKQDETADGVQNLLDGNERVSQDQESVRASNKRLNSGEVRNEGSLAKRSKGSSGTGEDSTETRTDKNSGEDSTKSQEGHVMLSYNWESKAQVLRIKKELKKLGYKTWMDVDKMHGDLNERMAEAVEGAAVVVVFMTQKYEESHNCKKELNYADDKRKKIVPVKLEPKYKPSKALGLIVAGKLYTVFSGESQFESNFADLRKEIDAALGKNSFL